MSVADCPLQMVVLFAMDAVGGGSTFTEKVSVSVQLPIYEITVYVADTLGARTMLAVV